MSDLGLVLREINGLPAELRPIFTRIFTEVLKNLRLGHPTGSPPDPMVNFAGGFFQGTTAAIADDEFTIAHGFGRTPYLAWPVVPLDTVGARIVDLTVTRAADDKRLYLSSSVTSAPITIAVEG